MRYVSSGQAARALGTRLRTLQQWVQDGLLVPDYYTPGGHARWDVERVREELRHPSRRQVEPGTVAARLIALGLVWKHARAHLAAGRVTVDGEVVTDPRHPAPPATRVAIEVP